MIGVKGEMSRHEQTGIDGPNQRARQIPNVDARVRRVLPSDGKRAVRINRDGFDGDFPVAVAQNWKAKKLMAGAETWRTGALAVQAGKLSSARSERVRNTTRLPSNYMTREGRGSVESL